MSKSAKSANDILGNSEPKCPKKPKESKKYCLTLNNWTEEELNTMEQSAEKNKFKYLFGKEIGEKCGTPHLQGFILMPSKHSITATNKLLGCIRNHLTPMNGSIKHNVDYCTKGGNWVTNMSEYKMKKPLKLITTLKPWMIEIEELNKTEPDGRSIYWYWENIGGVGKSQFCKYMYVKYQSLVIQGGKLADIMNILFNTNMDDVNMVIIDVPRKNGNKISYGAVECILNGMITNTKYETGIKVFNPPHVVVFSNFEPDTDDTLSADRWKIKKITN